MSDSNTLNRREFTAKSALALLSGVTITVSGCGGSSSSPSSPSPSPAPGPAGTPKRGLTPFRIQTLGGVLRFVGV